MLSLRRERVRRYAQHYEFAAAVDVAALKYGAADPAMQFQRTLLSLVRDDDDDDDDDDEDDTSHQPPMTSRCRDGCWRRTPRCTRATSSGTSRCLPPSRPRSDPAGGSRRCAALSPLMMTESDDGLT